jgi:hypothetical protein
MSDKHWYQDGWVVLVIVFFVGFFGFSFYIQHVEQSTPLVIPSITGRIEPPAFFGSSSLELTVWHQNAGNLRNGTIKVRLNEKDLKEHSYEVWEPNEAHAVRFSFPLPNYDPQREIPFEIALYGKGIKPFQLSDAWLGSTWKSNQK